MVWATSTFRISLGLMFASKKRIDKGICLVMPIKKDVKFGASVTMFFCFFPMEILFVNSNFCVVDKVILKPWRLNYTPKSACMYVIESSVGKFKDINIKDIIKLEK